MTTSSATRLEVDVMTLLVYSIPLTVVALLAVPILSFILRPYANNIRAVRGPPSKHWLFGSWDKEAYVSGKYEQYFLKTIEEYGPVWSLVSLGRRPMLSISDHRAVCKIMLQTPYNRQARTNGLVRRHVGRGLLSEEGLTHRRQRKVAQPAFTANAVFDMSPIFTEKTEQFVAKLRNAIASDADSAKQGVRINMATELNSIALDVIGAAGFGYEFNSLTGAGNTSDLEEAFQTCMYLMSSGTLYAALRLILSDPIVAIGRFFKLEEQAKLDRARALVEEVSADLVRNAKKNAEAGDSSAKDVLSLMVRANISEDIKPSQRLADIELQQMVPVFLLAGHETTSTALSWTCHSMIQGERGQQLQHRLREELDSPEASGWQSDAHVLDSLPYLDAFIRETLRFHCPVRQMSRDAPYDDVIPLSRPVKLAGGTLTDRLRIKKGQGVIFSVKWLNTSEELWGADAQKFKPERWLPEGHRYYENGTGMDESVKELKGVYSHLLSFGAGPAQCIGAKLSLMEMKFILTALVNSFDLLPPNLPGEPDVKMMGVTQIVCHPMVVGEWEKGVAMPVRLRARSKGDNGTASA